MSYYKTNSREQIAKDREKALNSIRKNLMEIQEVKLKKVEDEIKKGKDKEYSAKMLDLFSETLALIGLVTIPIGAVTLFAGATFNLAALGALSFSILSTGMVTIGLSVVTGIGSALKRKDISRLKSSRQEIIDRMQYMKEREEANTSEKRDLKRNHIFKLKNDINELKNAPQNPYDKLKSDVEIQWKEAEIPVEQKSLLESSPARRELAHQLRQGLAERLEKQRENIND